VSFLDGNNYIKPLNEEIEISIFGPGIGECIVIHLGDNKWIIVDSCIEKNNKQPTALNYLNKLGVNFSTDVKLFVVTHWHDDHIKGAAKILESCTEAKFVCSDALRNKEFYQLARSYSKNTFMTYSGIDEFNKIFNLLKSRRSNRRESGPDYWAIADKRLLYFTKPEHIYNVEIFSLSPSDTSVTISKTELAELIPNISDSKCKLIDQNANKVAVALWVKIEDVNIILGSDLENYNDKSIGWKAVLFSENRPHEKASIIKVPHHGSNNAHCEDMWNQMMVSDPVALLTPYASGSKPLPSKIDIRNIKSHTNKLYCTARPKFSKTVKRNSAINKTINEMAHTFCTIEGAMGHVQVRFSIENPEPQIRCFNGAKKL